MNIDTELASWKQEWREQTDLLPDIRKKIRRQDRRAVIGITLACICMVLSAVAAWRLHRAFYSGLAAGVWFGCLTMGAYIWRVRRGTWKPAAQTTAAYIELLHQRAITKARIARFAFRFLLITAVLYAGFVAWTWKDFSSGIAMILMTIVAEVFLLHHIARKKQQEIKTTQKLLESSKESSEASFTGGQS